MSRASGPHASGHKPILSLDQIQMSLLPQSSAVWVLSAGVVPLVEAAGIGQGCSQDPRSQGRVCSNMDVSNWEIMMQP